MQGTTRLPYQNQTLFAKATSIRVQTAVKVAGFASGRPNYPGPETRLVDPDPLLRASHAAEKKQQTNDGGEEVHEQRR